MGSVEWVCPADLTSDQGVVYHLKHGLSKQVVSPSGLVKLPPHASLSNIWNFPPLMPTHSTTLRFMPRPQVVLHCGENILLYAASFQGNHVCFVAPHLHINVQENLNVCYPLPLLAQPVWSTVSPPTRVDGQRFVLNCTLVVGNDAALRGFTVHVTHHLPLATGPRALQQHMSKVKIIRFLPGRTENPAGSELFRTGLGHSRSQIPWKISSAGNVNKNRHLSHFFPQFVETLHERSSIIHEMINKLKKQQKKKGKQWQHTHRPPLRHGPVALAGWTCAVFDVWWFGHWVTRFGLVGAPDITSHLGLTTTFSRTLDEGAKSYVIYCLQRKCSDTAHTSVHSATSHCGPQAGLLQGRLSIGLSRSARVQSSL